MNRHADALSDFTECVQAALDRNGHKPDLTTLSEDELLCKLDEELEELVLEIAMNRWRNVEREAADLAVCALAAFMRARERGREADGIPER